MPPNGESSLSVCKEATTYCRQTLPGVSRTFSLGIEQLKDPLRDEITVGYLVCRLLDALEDSIAIAVAPRAELLRRFSRSLFQAHDWRLLAEDVEALFADRSTLPDPDHALCRHCVSVLQAFHCLPGGAQAAMQGSIVEMAHGMAKAIESVDSGFHLETMEDLREYCHCVAGTVGELLTNVFSLERSTITEPVREQMANHAESFGLGLQVTNIVKGIAGDFRRGTVYVPRILFREFGIEVHEAVAKPGDSRTRRVLSALVNQTLIWLDEALLYTLAIPETEKDIRMFCVLPMTLALRTLALVMRTTTSLDELKITRNEVGDLYNELSAALDDGALHKIYTRERKAVQEQTPP